MLDVRPIDPALLPLSKISVASSMSYLSINSASVLYDMIMKM